jgi:hypothetical protein
VRCRSAAPGRPTSSRHCRKLLGRMPDTHPGGTAAAVCVSGQMRALVAAQLHVRLRDHVLDPLPADAFLSLDLDDTRAWGKQLKPSRADYDEALRVLRPVAHELISLVPPDGGRSCGAPAAGERVCQAHDCGTFNCGCYINGCTHCEVAAYIPMHDHNSRCLTMIARHEAIRPTGRCGAATPIAVHHACGAATPIAVHHTASSARRRTEGPSVCS